MQHLALYVEEDGGRLFFQLLIVEQVTKEELPQHSRVADEGEYEDDASHSKPISIITIIKFNLLLAASLHSISASPSPGATHQYLSAASDPSCSNEESKLRLGGEKTLNIA
jgi:hypothetical protein